MVIIQQNQVGLKFNETRQLLVYADDVNLLGNNIDTTEKNTKLSLRLEATAKETKYMLLSHHQNSEQNHDIKIVNKSFVNVAQFKYLGTTVINQNLIQEEIRRLNSGNAYYHLI
jgi:hypothetical protein